MVATVIESYLRQLRVGDPTSHGGLTLVPLVGGSGEPPDYQMLDEALAAGTLTVAEVSEGGRVPELAVQNAGPANVLMLDGEELIGAKQNRILNLSILVAAGSTMTVPVSCVEQGRWRSMSASFASGHYAPPPLRDHKERSVRENLRTQGVAMSDQCQVWDDVENALRGSATVSSTRAMADAYRQRRETLRDAAERFAVPEGTCGLAAFVRNELVVLDLFGYAATLRQVSRKLIDSYVLAALNEDAGRRPGGGDGARRFDARKAVAEVLERAAVGAIEQRTSVGLGTDVRLTGKGIRGAALVHEEKLVHASLFPDDGVSATGRIGGASRMASPRRRKRQG